MSLCDNKYNNTTIPLDVLLEIMKYLPNIELAVLLNSFGWNSDKLLNDKTRHRIVLYRIILRNHFIFAKNTIWENGYPLDHDNNATRKILLHWVADRISAFIQNDNINYIKVLFMTISIIDTLFYKKYHDNIYKPIWKLIAGIAVHISLKKIYSTCNDIDIKNDMIQICNKNGYSILQYTEQKNILENIISDKDYEYKPYELIKTFFNIIKLEIEEQDDKEKKKIDIICYTTIYILLLYIIDDDLFRNKRSAFTIAYSIIYYTLSKFNCIDLLDDIFEKDFIENSNKILSNNKSILSIINMLKIHKQHITIISLSENIFSSGIGEINNCLLNIPTFRKYLLYYQTSNDAQEIDPVYCLF